MHMQPDASSSTPPAVPERKRRSAKFFFVMLLLLIAAFLGGFIPETMRARQLEATLHATQLNLRLADLHRRLGVAAEEAQRNNYASAAASAREFFNGCAALLQAEAFADQPRTRNAIIAYASYRNEVEAQLAIADPQVKERLAGLYLTMDGVLARRE
jgi:hypothetical protein